ELHPEFRRFIAALRDTRTPVQVRSNLTVHLLPETAGCLSFLAEQQVGIVASLPCYLEQNVDRQRGGGAFTGSIQVLQALNRLGYGTTAELPLHLVYNPLGMSLPPPQQDLEQAYREQLQARYGIRFTGLYTITNMPIGRFAQDLETQGRLGAYLDQLAESFNPATIDDLMCRHQIEVDWDGRIYDCDFNLALGLGGSATIHEVDPALLRRRRIVTGEHCLGCTAGCGSSCGGALTDGERRRAAG
ncbi:MAG: arsenosugar biosynthesis radical SAM (seleno)protein ArsS, partial [Planctomycetota bacterium]